MDYCGIASGRTLDKAEQCGFNLITLNPDYPQAIKECPHHLLCDIIEAIPFGSHTAFIANVAEEYIDEDCVAEDMSFNYEIIQPIAYCRKAYYSVQERIGTYGESHKGELERAFRKEQ